MSRSIPALLLALLVSALAACGGGDGNDDESGDTTSSGDTGDGMTVAIDPDSGSSGTAIQWSISGCEAGDEKSATLYDLPLEEYQTGAQAKPLTKTIRGDETSGTLTVPAGTPAGDYTFAAGCSSTEKTGDPGEFTIGVKSTETGFTVSE